MHHVTAQLRSDPVPGSALAWLQPLPAVEQGSLAQFPANPQTWVSAYTQEHAK